MRHGHFHLHSRAVYRSNGHSAVAASAYQANEVLAHEKKNRGSVSLDFRKELNKGRISQGLRVALVALGITLSDAATATKDGRRDWTISDGETTYAIREYRQTTVNKDTGKQETVGQALDVYGDRTYDYTRKRDMVDKWMQAPESAPAWVQDAVQRQDRQGFWNRAEDTERYRNGRPARTIEMALSRHLSTEENRALVRAFVKEQLTDKGLVADVAMHSKTASDGSKNIHAHILFTTREIDKKGAFADTKDDYWNSKARIEDFRHAWAQKLNRAFEQKGLDVRVDHRSYREQGSRKTPGEHLGPAAAHMEQRGHETDKGDRNRRTDLVNAVQEALHPPHDPAPAAPPPATEAMSQEAQALQQAIQEYHQHSNGQSGANRTQTEQAAPQEARALRQAVQGYYQRSGAFTAATAEMVNRLRAFGRAFLRQAAAFARDESSAGGSSLLDKYTPDAMTWRERIERERKIKERRHERER